LFKKGTPFGRSLPVYPSIESTPPGSYPSIYELSSNSYDCVINKIFYSVGKQRTGLSGIFLINHSPNASYPEDGAGNLVPTDETRRDPLTRLADRDYERLGHWVHNWKNDTEDFLQKFLYCA